MTEKIISVNPFPVLFFAILSLLNISLASQQGTEGLKAAGWRVDADGVWSKALDISPFISRCQQYSDPKARIEFPIFVQGAHELTLDGRIIGQSGDPTFKRASNIWAILSKPCSEIRDGKQLVWTRYTATPLNIHDKEVKPEVSEAPYWMKFFADTLLHLTLGGLVFAFFVLILFRKSLPRKLLLINLLTLLAYGFLLAFADPNILPWTVSQAVSQKFSDAGLWLGIGGMFSQFYFLGLMPKRLLQLGAGGMFVCAVGVIISSNQNEGQVFSDIGPFIGVVVLIGAILFNCRRIIKSRSWGVSAFWEIFPILVLLATAVNDTLILSFGVETYPVFPIALVSTYLASMLFLSRRFNILTEQEMRLQELTADLAELSRVFRNEDNIDKSTFKSEPSRALADWADALRKELKEKQDWILTMSRDASRGALMNQVIHDLKSPLSALQLIARQLNLDSMEEKVFKGAITRLTDITGSLRRSETEGTQRLSSLRDSLRPLYIECGWLAKHHQLELQWSWPDAKDDPPLLIDHGLLSRSVDNLIRNSIESIEEKRKSEGSEPTSYKLDRLRVWVSRTETLIHIEVSDSGLGLKMITDQLPLSTKGSSGIGLSVVKEFCEKHHGRFYFSIAPKEGYSAEACMELRVS